MLARLKGSLGSGVRPLSAVALAGALCLSGCGGGSTLSEPPRPPSVFSGNDAAAIVDPSSAVGLAQDLFLSTYFLGAHGGGGRYAPGKVGGFGSVSPAIASSGLINPDGSGWVQTTYSHYQVQASNNAYIVYNGDSYWFQDKGKSGDPISGIEGFKDFTEITGGVTYTYNGTLAFYDDGHDLKMTSNVSISTSDGRSWLMSDFVMEEPTHTKLSVALSGRIIDSTFGYVDITTPGNVVLLDSSDGVHFPDAFPQSPGSGEVVFTGARGAAAHVVTLNEYFVWLGLDADGDGIVEQGGRLDRLTGALDATPTPQGAPVAAPELLAAAALGSPGTVDARFSYAPGALVSYAWSIVQVPAASSLLINSSGPTVQLTPDVPGRYVLKLTVTQGGGQSAAEMVTVDVSASTAPLAPSGPPTLFWSPPRIAAHAGSPVTVDGRASIGATRNSVVFQQIGGNAPTLWTLHTPAGSNAKLDDPTAIAATFTPDVPGLYYVDFVRDLTGSLVDVDEHVHLGPAVPVASGAQNADNILSGNFASGASTGVAYMVAGYPNSMLYWSTPSVDHTHFSVPAQASLAGIYPAGTAPGKGVSWDLNGDGIADMEFPSAGCGVDLYLSGPAGYSWTTLSYGSTCNQQRIVRNAFIAGKPAVVTVDGQGRFETFTSDGHGNFQPAVATPISGYSGSNTNIADLQLLDVDGDGEPDLVVVDDYQALTDTGYIQVYHGNGDGSFTYVNSYNPAGTGPDLVGLVFGDFTGHGRQDLAVMGVASSGLSNLYVLPADGHGNYGAAIVKSAPCGGGNIRLADLNRDGRPDIVVSPFLGCSGTQAGLPSTWTMLGLFLSQSDGSLSDQQIYPMDFGRLMASGIEDTAIGDYDGDGHPDLFLLSQGNVYVVPNIP